MIKRILFGHLVLGSIQSCYYDKEEELYPNDYYSTNDTTSVTYGETIAPLISTNCGSSGCHPAYTTYTGLKVIVDNGQLKNRVITQKTMPAAAPLSSTQISKLQRWLDAGALNN
jgi:hypothetical protein